MSAPPRPFPGDHEAALRHLRGDPVMAQVTAAIGGLPVLSPTPDPFGTLVRNVAGQQLSVRAAEVIHARLLDTLGDLTPDTLGAVEGETLRGAGLSWAKVRTVQALAQAHATGRIDFASLAHREDAEVVAALTELPGIGRWTAEMFLMFGLARPDVFSLGDLGLRQGLARLYPAQAPDRVVTAWAPYRTLAARYLWADNARVRAAGAGR